MVDVEQDRVVGPPRTVRIESHRVRCGAEEIRADQRDAVVGGQPGRVRKQIALMPIDHRIAVFDDGHSPNPIAAQRFLCRIAKAQAPDDHIQVCSRCAGQSKAGQFPLGDGEQA